MKQFREGTLLFEEHHPLFLDHFPRAPRVPGSLVISALIVEAEKLFPDRRVLRASRFRFLRFLQPGSHAFRLEFENSTRIRCIVGPTDAPLADGTLELSDEKENSPAQERV